MKIAPLLLALGMLHAEESPFRFSLTGGYTFGQFIDIDQNYGDVGWLFFCPVNCQSTIFLQDTQFFFLDRGDFSFSAGAGLRQRFPMLSGYIGANVYYDYRDFNSSRDSLYRMGVGVEYLSNSFEARVNGYIPIGNTYSKGNPITINYLEGFQAILRNTEMALWGIDGEVGYWFASFKCLDFYAGVGVYSYGTYNRDDIKHNPFTGGYARALLTWNNYFNFEVRVSDDQVFKGRMEGVLWAQLPFEFFLNGFCMPYCIDPCEKIWTRPVFRHSILATTDCCCYDSWNWRN